MAERSNGKQLAAATADAVINLWCLLTYQPLVALQGHGDTVWGVESPPFILRFPQFTSEGYFGRYFNKKGFLMIYSDLLNNVRKSDQPIDFKGSRVKAQKSFYTLMFVNKFYIYLA